jgi:hypothetical protein
MGHPAYSRNLKDFDGCCDAGATKIRFPLMLGDIHRANDGLIGCFDDADGFSLMYSTWGANISKDAVYIKSDAHPMMAADDGNHFVTMLMEPDLPFTIQTGLLPVQKEAINGAHTDLSQKLFMAVEIDPIVSNKDTVQMPVINTDLKWYTIKNNQYTENEISSPVVDFSESIIMDGLLVKDTEGQGRM